MMKLAIILADAIWTTVKLEVSLKDAEMRSMWEE